VNEKNICYCVIKLTGSSKKCLNLNEKNIVAVRNPNTGEDRIWPKEKEPVVTQFYRKA